jgi:signal transduction histidine kinase
MCAVEGASFMTDSALTLPVDDDALGDWRRRATALVITASALVHLPILILILADYGPPLTVSTKASAVACYLVVLVCAFARGVGYRFRVWVLQVTLYLLAVIGTIAAPQGPYIRAVPMVAPMLAIGLLGVRAARICTVVSAVLLMLAPFLSVLPGTAWVVAGRSDPALLRPGLVLMQGAALTADMVVVMILLERFYGFLLQALTAQRMATADRAAAGRKLEGEIEERRRLEREIARVGDDERRRLGNEIHDGVCQQLTGALLRCQALELRLERGTPLPAEELGALSSLLGETIQEARSVAQGLCPLEPTPDALAPALRSLARRTWHLSGVRCEFRTAGDISVPDQTTAQHIYRIAQEALSNAVRHARASRIWVELHGNEDALVLRVEDNGVGLPGAPTASSGMGLRTMAFRAKVLEGGLSVEPAPGGGTRVACRVPRAAFIRADGRPGAVPAEGSR